AGEGVNRIGELDACVHDLLDERVGEEDAARMAVNAAARDIGDVGPVLEKNPAAAFFADDIETAFKTDKIFPGFAALARHSGKGFGALPRSGHHIVACERRVAHAAGNFDADHFKLDVGIEGGSENADCFPDGIQLWPARAAHGDNGFFHSEAGKLTLPELSLPLAGEARTEKALQLLDGRKYAVGACQHPAADFRERLGRYEIHGDALA